MAVKKQTGGGEKEKRMRSEERVKFGKVLIFAVLIVTFVSVSVGCASAATIYVNPGDSIQDAVNAASDGDTIIVRDGTYTENVDINKRLTIRSENGSAVTIVNASDSNDYVFNVTADYVNLSGFTVENATQGVAPTYTAGIYLYYVDHCNISGNTVSNNYCGIWLNSSDSSIISNNNASSNMDTSIVLVSSNNNTIYNNTASSNIGVDYSGHVYSWGFYLGGSSNNNITANIANSNPGDLSWGIYIDDASNYNTLADNNFSNNVFGVYLTSSSDNTLTCCTVSNNYYGVYLSSSSNNLIYNNYFNNALTNAYDDGDNIWNIQKTAGANIIGSSYLGGNYWSDYTGEDLNGDGLGDTLLPHDSSGGILTGGDYLPLVPASISIYTDKTSYTAGDTMRLGLDVNNPGSARSVCLDIYLEQPTSSTFTLIDTVVTLPAGLDYSKSNFKVFTVPSISAGTYAWQAGLSDPVTGALISEDTAEWVFGSRGASTETEDITEVLEQITIVIDFGERCELTLLEMMP